MMPGVVTTRLKGFYVVEIAKLKIVSFCKEVITTHSVNILSSRPLVHWNPHLARVPRVPQTYPSDSSGCLGRTYDPVRN